LNSTKKTTCGRKRTIALKQVLNGMFFIADNGLKMSYIKDQFGNAKKNTYYYYFNLIAKYQILEQLYRELIVENTTLGKSDFVITDTFTVKSMDGSQGLGRNPTDRGRKNSQCL